MGSAVHEKDAEIKRLTDLLEEANKAAKAAAAEAAQCRSARDASVRAASDAEADALRQRVALRTELASANVAKAAAEAEAQALRREVHFPFFSLHLASRLFTCTSHHCSFGYAHTPILLIGSFLFNPCVFSFVCLSHLFSFFFHRLPCDSIA
jgi:hypothetical protein